MRVDRWNCGDLRRYHHPSGAIVVIHGRGRTKRCKIIPASCRHIAIDVAADVAIQHIKEGRHQ